ncbi:hypothetical protein OG586_08735 [Streptomyces murinus]|uniref:hypothetical protein n=1 Tax=Streptomyces murinus TaxID=33900 RepID=UPI002E8015CD|nr:hypothetical protein [Streptomyces murinus]WUD06302.1 hypothetical protein OG586_08735 [Streptomyces murinus]
MIEGDEPAPESAFAGGEHHSKQINWATGGIVYAVQNGNQYILGPDARALFAQWERSLRRGPGSLSVGPSQELTIARDAVLANMTGVLADACTPQVVVVRGEPGVGKTALVLRSVDVLRDRSVPVLAAGVRSLVAHAGNAEALVCKAADPDGTSALPAMPGLLVLDGAEAVQEGLEDLLAEIVDAARTAGLVPVLVSRDDAVDTLDELLNRIGRTDVREMTVPPLEDREISEVLASAPQLAKVAADGRSRWLLRRLALIDLLLRSARRSGELPSPLESEAAVYTYVWHALILNRGRTVDGVAADDREQTLVSLAETRLTERRAPFIPGRALASLRSDGVLAPRDEASVTSSEEHSFAHDVLRDFATARRLLLDDGLPLLEARGPRWAVRAARVYCQARLRGEPNTPAAFRARWSRVHRQFTQLAQTHGARWEEVPWEAVLSAGWCAEALDALSEQLLCESDMLGSLLRCAVMRFGDGRLCDPLVGAPVVKWLVPHLETFSGRQDLAMEEFILAWLRGMAQHEAFGRTVEDHRPVRVLVCEAMLRASPAYPSKSHVEALALLGGDRGAAAVSVLKRVARDNPHKLMPAVERAEAVGSLAATDPALLLDLALSYYVPPLDERLGEGVRRRRRRIGEHEYLGSAHQRRSQWWRGPFFSLLLSDRTRGLKLIEAIAARAVEQGTDYEQSLRGGETAADVLVGDFLGIGECRYVGGAQAWSWYRGRATLDGSQACVSALMALDQWLRLGTAHTGVTTVREAAFLVLTRVGTTAGLGLAYGTLLGRLDEVTDELDDFLATPLVWGFERGRYVKESVFRGTDEAPTDDWLRYSPVQVAMSLVATAFRRRDEDALERLKAVADRLRAASVEGLSDVDVRFWADHLDWERYVAVRHGDKVALEVRSLEEIQHEVDSRRVGANRVSKQYELLNRYALSRTLPRGVRDPDITDLAQLSSDLRTARELQENHVGEDEGAHDGIHAVAAAAVHMASLGAALDSQDLRWSVDLLAAAVSEPVDLSYGPRATHPWAGNRLAALALPRLLSPVIAASAPWLLDTGRTTRVLAAMRRAVAHPLDEVREYAGEGLRPLWSMPCPKHGDCHHVAAWQAVEAAARTALGSEDKGAEAPAFLLSTLCQILDAARTPHCRTSRAAALRGPLLEAYARAVCDLGSESPEEHHASLAACLLRTVVTEPAVMYTLADRLADAPSAICHLLRGLKTAATYDHDLVQPLGIIWPYLMESVLTQPALSAADEDRFAWHDRAELMDELAPNPLPLAGDADIDGTLSRARGAWLPLPPMAELLDAWSATISNRWSAVDNLIGFLKAQPVHEQLEPGLLWVRRLCVTGDGKVESAGFCLPEWLRDLHPELTSNTRPHFQALVDGLAFAQHPEAVSLQRIDE